MASPLPTDHAGHDETLIAAAAAGDLDDAAHARAEALIAACPDCARLVRDLQVITAATRAMPAPVRPRDFRLTGADVARGSAAREPSGGPTRHSGVDPIRHLPTHHADHDETLLAAAAVGDLDAAELARAEALIATCPDCARLVRDLDLITAATRALPAPVRPRDFRLTADQAARASGGVWGRLRVRWSVTLRPLAVGLTTLGLVGMIVAVASPGGSVGLFAAGGTSDGSRQSDTGALLPEGAPSAAASMAPAPSSAAAPGGTTDKTSSSAGPPAPPATNGQGSAAEAPTAAPSSAPAGGPTVPATPAAGGPSALFLASGLVAVAGVMLLTAPIVRDRRRRDAPGRPDVPS